VDDYAKANGKERAEFISIASYGCVLVAVVNAVYNLTGRQFNLRRANDFLSGKTDIDGKVNENEPGVSYFEGKDGNLFSVEGFAKAVNALGGSELISLSSSHSGLLGQLTMEFAQQNPFMMYIAKVRVDNGNHHVLGSTYNFWKNTMTVVDSLYSRRAYNKGYNIMGNTQFDLYRVTQAGVDAYNNAWG
jgi:hypothetical protein